MVVIRMADGHDCASRPLFANYPDTGRLVTVNRVAERNVFRRMMRSNLRNPADDVALRHLRPARAVEAARQDRTLLCVPVSGLLPARWFGRADGFDAGASVSLNAKPNMAGPGYRG